MGLVERRLAPLIQEALADTPVVLLNGPRQAGKSTLAATYGDRGFRMLSLDDAATLASAREDPTGLVRSLDRAVIDEVQRAPELLLAIKQSVDNDRRPGRFLLTGSADLRLLPSVADSLAGRMEVLTLLPLAGCELDGAAGQWLECVLWRHPKASQRKSSHRNRGDTGGAGAAWRLPRGSRPQHSSPA